MSFGVLLRPFISPPWFILPKRANHRDEIMIMIMIMMVFPTSDMLWFKVHYLDPMLVGVRRCARAVSRAQEP